MPETSPRLPLESDDARAPRLVTVVSAVRRDCFFRRSDVVPAPERLPGASPSFADASVVPLFVGSLPDRLIPEPAGYFAICVDRARLSLATTGPTRAPTWASQVGPQRRCTRPRWTGACSRRWTTPPNSAANWPGPRQRPKRRRPSSTPGCARLRMRGLARPH